MKQFKPEFKNSKILVKTASLGKIEINTETADPEKWANVPELSFMFEDTKGIEKKKAEIKIEKVDETPTQPTKASIDDFTKKEIEAMLKENGIEIPKKANKTQLFELLNS